MKRSHLTGFGHKHKYLPSTPHGRALYTVSWYLHGIEPKVDLDARRFNIREVNNVYAGL